MRKIILIISLMAFSVMGFSQACLNVISANFSNPSNDGITWVLTINYTANGHKNLETTVNCGVTQILYDCYSANGSGTKVYSGIMCLGGLDQLSATFTPRTGSCGSAACAPTKILPPAGGPLPVTISSFTVKRFNNSVTVSWKTETEINSKEFILERKIGNDFVSIATIAAANKATGSNYTYVDNSNISKQVSQYRLKVIDLNGTFKYSTVSAVKGTSTVSDFTVFPNPSNGNTKVSISDVTEATNVQLIDLSGRLLKNIATNNNNTVELNGLQSGVYVIRIQNTNTGEATTKKLTVIN